MQNKINNHSVVNCTVYKNSIVKIIFSLSKFPKKIGGVTNSLV